MWCKDCFQLWGTWLKDSSALALLPTWLRDAQHRLSWDLHLIALISIRREGQETVRKQMLEARVEAFELLLEALQLSARPVVVKPLEEATEATMPRGRLVTILGDKGQLCLGQLVALEQMPPAHTSIFLEGTRSNTKLPVPRAFAARVWTDRESDSAFIGQLSSGGGGEVGSSTLAVALSDDTAHAVKRKTGAALALQASSTHTCRTTILARGSC